MATTEVIKGAVLTAKGFNPPRPRRAPGPKDPKADVPDMIPAAMKMLAEQLDAMPTDELRKIAGNFRIDWPNMSKPAIIEQVLAAEEDQMRAARAKEAKEKVVEPPEKVLAADPDMVDGAITFTPTDLALIYAALLPRDAQLNVQSGTAQTYSRHAARIGQEDAVQFSKHDSKGVERRYRIEVAALTSLKVIELP